MRKEGGHLKLEAARFVAAEMITLLEYMHS